MRTPDAATARTSSNAEKLKIDLHASTGAFRLSPRRLGWPESLSHSFGSHSPATPTIAELAPANRVSDTQIRMPKCVSGSVFRLAQESESVTE